MIDFHSHILPGIDDGSKSISESLELLDMLAEQKVTTVVATPHFDANHVSVDRFLEKRGRAYEALRAEVKDTHPQIRLGAEVNYYPGISRMADLRRLCIEGSKLLLLEMPMSAWTEYTVKELSELAACGSTKVIIAHMDRYMNLQKKDTLRQVFDSDVLIQCNAGFFLDFWTKRKALTMLGGGWIHMLGSDCHSVRSRPPRIGMAVDVITKKFGEPFVDQLTEYGYAALGGNI